MAGPLPIFPDNQAWARALLEEGLRHLEDARVLHLSGRYPAAIASSMKAAELGLKTVLILDGALGWWERIHSTHTPLADISGHQILRRHFERLVGYRPTLPADVRELEALVPSRPGSGGFQVRIEDNPEYPFFTVTRDPATGDLVPELHSPAAYF
jgi:HEPN domain-containing protein